MPTRRRMRSTVISRCSAPRPETTSSRVASSCATREARILLHQAVERGADLLLGALALELHAAREERGRQVGRRVEEGVLLVGERLAAQRRLELGERDDVAGVGLVDVLRVLADHVGDLAEPLRVAGARVEQRRVGLERAREHARERGAPGVLVDRGLEDERGGGRVGGGARARRRVFLPGTTPFHGACAVGGGTSSTTRVEERGDAARARAGGEVDRDDTAPLQHGVAQALVELVLREVALGQVLLGELVARCRRRRRRACRGPSPTSFASASGMAPGATRVRRLGLADPRLLASGARRRPGTRAPRRRAPPSPRPAP